MQLPLFNAWVEIQSYLEGELLTHYEHLSLTECHHLQAFDHRDNSNDLTRLGNRRAIMHKIVHVMNKPTCGDFTHLPA